MKSMKPKVLCVDDEPAVLEGLALTLGRRFSVITETSPNRAAHLLEQDPSFCVVISDMRMPEMNGAVFLAKVKEIAPDTVRMLLTGQSDLEAAIQAVNEGEIFKFLTKPCPAERLQQIAETGVRQYRLITAERVLLEQTLRGCIQALTDTMALANPLAFGRATRVKKYVSEIAQKLQVRDAWRVEVAAMLSQLGCITLPADTLEKYYYGQDMAPEEQELVRRLPIVSKQLVAHIPRLDEITEMLLRCNEPYAISGEPRQVVPLGAHIIRVALDFDSWTARGYSSQLALDTMRSTVDAYSPKVLAAFAELQGARQETQGVRALPLRALQVGMVFAEDVLTETGAIFVSRGYVVTDGFIARAQNLKRGFVKEPIRVLVVEDSQKLGATLTELS